MSKWINIARAREFSPGESRLLELEQVNIAIFNLDDNYFAIEDNCTHAGSPMLGCGLDAEEIINGEEIICPHHGARFCIRTGAALNSPAFEPLAKFTTRIENGTVQVDIESITISNP